MLGAGDVGDAAAAEGGEVLDGELGAALVVGEEAEGVGVVGLGEDVDDGEAVGEAGRWGRACRRGGR